MRAPDRPEIYDTLDPEGIFDSQTFPTVPPYIVSLVPPKGP